MAGRLNTVTVYMGWHCGSDDILSTIVTVVMLGYSMLQQCNAVSCVCLKLLCWELYLCTPVEMHCLRISMA